MSEGKKTYSQMINEFYQNYKSKIVFVMRQHESERKVKLVLAILASSILFLVASALLYTAFSSLHWEILSRRNEGVLEVIIIIYALSYFSWFWIKKDFEHNIKLKIMKTVCECLGNIKWSHDSYPLGKMFSDSFVVPEFNSQEYDDVFNGYYNDVHLQIVESEYAIESRRNSRIVFDGVIIKIDMNKEFTSHTVIKQDTLLHTSPSSKLHKTELEDIEFNKKFDVFTNDDVDARYLITPSFMERLKNMKTAFKAKGMTCAFYKTYLIVALSTKRDLFSICSLVKPLDDEKQFFTMFEEILSIMQLIDHFKLNQKIGL